MDQINTIQEYKSFEIYYAVTVKLFYDWISPFNKLYSSYMVYSNNTVAGWRGNEYGKSGHLYNFISLNS